MANGIIVDVGFKADISKLISDINSEFKKIDFDDALNLSKSFEKQEKEIKTKLKSLKNEIDKSFCGNFDDSAVKQMQSIQKEMSSLTKNMSALIKAMPDDISSKFSQNLTELRNEVSDTADVCKNAINAISDIGGQTGAKIKLVDTSELEEEKNKLTKTYGDIKHIIDDINKSLTGTKGIDKSGKTKFKDFDEVLDRIDDYYKRLENAEGKYIYALDTEDTSKIRSAASEYGKALSTMQKYINEFSRQNGNLSETLNVEWGGDFLSVRQLEENIRRSMDDVKSVLVSEMSNLESIASSKFNFNVSDYYTKSTRKVPENAIAIPMDISTTGSDLASRALKIIEQAQNRVEGTPLEVEVKLMSSYKSSANQKKLKEIANNLESSKLNIDDDLKSKTLSMINDMTHGIDNALLFNVDINTEKATRAVKEFVSEAKDSLKELSEELIAINPAVMIDDEAKQLLIEDFNALAEEMNTMFNTGAMNTWSQEFINNLNNIGTKLDSIFGENELSKVLKGWTESDKMMSSKLGVEHLRERSGVIGSSGKFYGQYDYDQHKSTIFGYNALESALKNGEKGLIGIHTHPEKYASISSVFKDDKGNFSGDIAAFAQEYKQGVEAQLTKAFNEINVFDAKGFYSSNSKIDFTSVDVMSKIADARQKLSGEINKLARTLYIDEFNNILKNFNTSKVKSLFNQTANVKSFGLQTDEGRYVKSLIQNISPDNLINKLLSNLNGGYSIKYALANAMGSEIEKQLLKDGSNGFDTDIVNNVIDGYLDAIVKSDIFKNLGLDSITQPDIWQKALAQYTPEILRQAFSDGKGGYGNYKDNFEEFSKTYSLEDFISKNPLNLPSSSLNSIFDANGINQFLESVEKTVSVLEKLQTLLSSDSSKDFFNINIDETSITNFTESIEKLIGALNELPEKIKAISDATGSLKISNNPLNNLSETYEKYKKYYDNNDLESESGAKAALKYYDAYKEALYSKINKGDLKQYTIGSTDKLFTGNYSEYKNGVGNIDISGLNSEVSKYENIINNLNHPEITSTIDSISNAIKELINSGNQSDKTVAFLEQLNKSITSLSGNKSFEKIERFSSNLQELSKGFANFNIGEESGFLSQINGILDKSKDLQALAKVLKSNGNIGNKASINSIENSVINQIGAVESQFSKSLNGSANGTDKMIQSLKELSALYNDIQTLGAKGLIDPERFKRIHNYIESLKEDIKSMSSGNLEALSNKYRSTPEMLSSIELAKSELTQMEDIMENISSGKNLSEANIDFIRKLTEEFARLNTEVKETEERMANVDTVNKWSARIAKTLNTSSAMPKDLKEGFENILSSFKEMNGNIPLDAFDKLKTKTLVLESALQQSGKTGKSFFDMFKSNIMTKAAGTLAQYFSLYDIIRYTKEMANTVREYDTALTEMRKVSDESVSTLKEYQQESFGVANTVGTTGKQLQQSTADWLRLGETFSEAKESAKDSTILLNVSEFENIDDATTSLVAMSQAYTDLDKMQIIDKLNNIGKVIAYRIVIYVKSQVTITVKD